MSQLRRRRWSVDVGIADAIPKPGFGQASSAGQSGRRCTGQYRGPICLLLCEHGPGDAGQFVGQGHGDDIVVAPHRQLAEPRTQARGLFRAVLQDCACALDEEFSQVGVPTFADPEQLLLAAG